MLFQLPYLTIRDGEGQSGKLPVGTPATDKYLPKANLMSFLSFRMSDAESLYTNPEKAVLAVDKCL